jgi:hypothetical protein
MSLNHRQQRKLYRIESSLLRSDPHLAAMLAVFGRLSADQYLPAWEHITTRPDRIRQAAALITNAIAVMAAAIGLLLSAVLALLTAIVTGRPARRPESAREQTGPEANDRSDPASWS